VKIHRSVDAARLLALRRERLLSQLSLAARAGISMETLRLAEQFGSASPVTIAKLATALRVDARELLAAADSGPEAA
jgi:transcriptional regulator with XRE-family HTH domain